MNEGLPSRRKKLEKISLEELMGAAGMSGFSALLDYPPGAASAGSRLRLSLRVAAAVEIMGQQNDALGALQAPLARRIQSLERALGVLAQMKTAAVRWRAYSIQAGALHANGNGAALGFGM